MFYYLELIGIAAFAISGVMAARSKRPDIIGAVIIAFVTALGGGVIRDAIIGRAAVTFTDAVNFYVIIAASIIAIIVPEGIIKFNHSLLVADAVGLGVFTAGGILIALQAGTVPYVFAVLIAAVTGCGGGMIRDVLLNQMPLILRKEVYFSASVVGAICGLISYKLFNSLQITAAFASIVTICIRLAAIHFSWTIPLLRHFEEEKK